MHRSGWRIVDEDVRRWLTHIFPYGIFYTIEADYILNRRDALQPGAWLLEAQS